MPGIADLDYPQPRLISITSPTFVHSGASDASTPVENSLVDSNAAFDLADQFRHGAIVWNTATDAVANIVAVADSDTLTLSADIFQDVSGNEAYAIYMPANTQDRPEGTPPVVSTVVLESTTTAPGGTNYLTSAADKKFDHYVQPGDKVVNITDEEVLTVLGVIDDKNLLLDGPIATTKNYRVVRENYEYSEFFMSAEGTSVVGLAVDSKTVAFSVAGTATIPTIDAYTLNCIPTGLQNGQVVSAFTEILANANAQSGSNPLYAVSSDELLGLQVISGEFQE